jgi:O-methyltransferase domain/Dimerisation domain
VSGERPEPETPAAALGQMIRGGVLTQLVYVAVKLGVPELLREGPRPADVLAAATGAEPGTLYRLLRALASLGILVEDEQRRFALAPAGELLRDDVVGSLRGSALFYGEPWCWQAFGGLLEGVHSGTTPFLHVHGAGFFDYLARHADAAEAFHEHMLALTGQDAAAITAAYEFGCLGRVVDVGGGHGGLLAAILRAHPGVQGVLFDRPSVVEGAREFLGAVGLAERCDLVGGSFFDGVPAGADAYLLKDVLHDWEDEPAVAILRACRSATGPAARLLVVERVIPPGASPAPGKLTDVVMLVLTGGRERTEAEYRTLLEAGGFALARVVPTGSPMSILEARPV